MRKIAAIILAAGLLISVAACGTPDNANAPGVTKPSAASATGSGSNSGKGVLTSPVTLRFGCAASGGTDYADASIIAEYLGRAGVLPAGSKVSLETISSGGSTTGYLIEGKLADICRCQCAFGATTGVGDRGPYTSICALMGCASNTKVIQVASPSFVKKSGYKTIEEIIANKYPAIICTEQTGSTDYIVLKYILEAYGLTMDSYKAMGGNLVYTDGGTAAEMLQDGQADLWIAHTGTNSSTVTELAMTTDGIAISGLSEKTISSLVEKGFARTTIPTGSYNYFKESVNSAYLGTSIIVSKNMDFNLAYFITKYLMENSKEIGENCSTLRGVDYKMATDTSITVVPLHPGSIAYFQDAGVLDAGGKYIGK